MVQFIAFLENVSSPSAPRLDALLPQPDASHDASAFEPAPLAADTATGERALAFVTASGIQYGQIAAAIVLSVTPTLLLALYAQRYLVEGLSLGAVKG